MAYPTTAVFQPKVTTPGAGWQPILTTSTTKNHVVGQIVKAIDFGTGLVGESEYIYLPGVASTAAGDAVVFLQGTTFTTVRLADDVTPGLVAVAMSANAATTSYGWYAIKGCVPVNIGGSPSYNLSAYCTSSGGQVSETVVTGDVINGMFTLANVSTGFAYCQLANPWCAQLIPT